MLSVNADVLWIIRLTRSEELDKLSFSIKVNEGTSTAAFQSVTIGFKKSI